MGLRSLALEAVDSIGGNVLEHDVERAFSIVVPDSNLNFVVVVLWLDDLFCWIENQSASIKS